MKLCVCKCLLAAVNFRMCFSQKIPLCDPDTNNADKLRSYRLSVQPSTNFKVTFVFLHLTSLHTAMPTQA